MIKLDFGVDCTRNIGFDEVRRNLNTVAVRIGLLRVKAMHNAKMFDAELIKLLSEKKTEDIESTCKAYCQEHRPFNSTHDLLVLFRIEMESSEFAEYIPVELLYGNEFTE